MTKKQTEDFDVGKGNDDTSSLAHTKWNCKYHIVFAPKYRRKIFYESHRKEIMETIKELC
ncbi:MAG: transposase, partial [Clostridia bacterium]|nr:transposase [Clostridia bacterium]